MKVLPIGRENNYYVFKFSDDKTTVWHGKRESNKWYIKKAKEREDLSNWFVAASMDADALSAAYSNIYINYKGSL